MEKDEPKFGPSKNRTPVDRFVGEYVSIYNPTGTNSTGKITGIEEGYLILNPFSGVALDDERGIIKKLIEKDSIFSISNISSIEPTTKECIEALCDNFNKKNCLKTN